MRRSFLLVALLFSVACSSGASSVTMAEYCMREATAYCGVVAHCSCTVDMVACVAREKATCDGTLGATDLSMAISAGTIRFDADAAAALLARLDAAAPRCGDRADVFALTLGEVGTGGGLFVGTVPTGATCIAATSSGIEECADGQCIAHQCARLADIGSACDTSTICVDLARPLALASATQPSALCAHATCVRQNAPPGESCTSGAECASATCTMLHCQGLPSGLACIDDAACDSLYCHSTCSAPVGLGGACTTTGTPCAHGLSCTGGTCATAICS